MLTRGDELNPMFSNTECNVDQDLSTFCNNARSVEALIEQKLLPNRHLTQEKNAEREREGEREREREREGERDRQTQGEYDCFMILR